MLDLTLVAQQKIVTSQIILQRFQLHHAIELFTLIDNNREYLKKWLVWVDKVKKPQDSLNFINQVNNEIE